MAPNIAIHLKEFGLSPEAIGLTLGCPGILYACTCPFISLITERMKKRGIIVLGFIGIMFGTLMISGSKWLPFVVGYEL